MTVWENERKTILPHFLTGGAEGFSAKNLTKAERCQWSDGTGQPKASPHEDMGEEQSGAITIVAWELPRGWVWQGNWKVLPSKEKDLNQAPPDRHGWQYSFNWGNAWLNTTQKDSHIRRRRWGRVRVPTEDVDVLQAQNRERKKTAAMEVHLKRRDARHANAEDCIDGTVRAALEAQGAIEAFRELQFKEAYAFKVSFQWKNPDFLFKNPDFLIRNPDLLLNIVDFIIQQRGSLRKNWLRRWFVLHEGVLHYYATEADIKKHKKGLFRYGNMIVMDESCVCVDSEEVFKGKQCFELRTWDRVLPMYLL